ncbi:MAG: hypothetical protein KDB65_01215 [Calditrichaeota bacterium]|nr:hypothetical protein [Calditrichota bacterium]MCB9369161.1 hypothetical protein [Calditrichota bacterium]
MQIPSFDRLESTRRNRKLRNFFAIAAGITGIIAAVLVIDPMVSNEPLNAMPLLILAFLCFLCAGLTIYFHMRFISRD